MKCNKQKRSLKNFFFVDKYKKSSIRLLLFKKRFFIMQNSTLFIKKVEVFPIGGIGGVEINGLSRNLTASSSLIVLTYSDKTVIQLLVDLGLSQGSIHDNDINRELCFDPRLVKAIYVTHAHVDHCGRLPYAVSRGFNGPIYASKDTIKIAKLQLFDSAKLMAHKYEVELAVFKKLKTTVSELNTTGQRGVKKDSKGNRFSNTGFTRSQIIQNKLMLERFDSKNLYKDYAPDKPLYSESDVIDTCEMFMDIDQYNCDIPCVSVKTFNSGHVLGSKSILFTFKTKGEKYKRILFSGDIGDYHRDFQPHGEPQTYDKVRLDAILIESTYGGVTRPENYYSKGREEFLSAIEKELAKDKTVIIGGFAFDRIQEILYLVKNCDADIYLDTPLGVDITREYINTKNPLYKGLRYQVIDCKTRSNVLLTGKPTIIIATSGMYEGGPIIDYITNYISNKFYTFVITGYTPERTIGGKLSSGQKSIKIKIDTGEIVEKEVFAKILNFNFMSGHADEKSIIKYLGGWSYQNDAKIYINHGDVEKQSLALKHTIMRKQEQYDICKGAIPHVLMPNDVITL